MAVRRSLISVVGSMTTSNPAVSVADRVEVRVRLEDEQVISRERGTERTAVQAGRGRLVRAAPAERRRVQHDTPLAELRVARQDVVARRRDGRGVGEEVRPGRSQRQDATRSAVPNAAAHGSRERSAVQTT